MGIFRRIRALGKRTKLNREIEAELQEHIRMRAEVNEAQGMSPEQAALSARLRFGNPAVFKEHVQAEDAALGFSSLLRDVQYALRGFRNSAGFTAVAIITLALGIGANTAVFQLLDAVRLRSLPIQKPQEIAELLVVDGKSHGFGVTNSQYAHFTIPMWQEIRRHHDAFSGVFAWGTVDMMQGQVNEGKGLQALEVSGDFFNVLGVLPWQGRLIEPQDEAGCELSKVVVSYSYWKAQLGGRPITANTTVVLDGHPVQILGVTPPAFFGMVVGERFDVIRPTCTPADVRRDAFSLSVMGRLKPGWNLARASGYLGSISPGLFDAAAPTGYEAKAIESFKKFKLAAYPAGAGVSSLRESYDSSLQMLLAITGLVLLIACANLANLMLARASARQREMAIRMALGASRRRMVRQLLIESALLAMGGAAIGIALAQPLSRLLVTSLNTSQYAIHLDITTDWRVLLFATAVATLTCIVFGTIPAMRGASADPISALKSGERGIAGHRERFSVQRAMVVTQIAVSMVLLVAALLFVRSYRNLSTLDTGMHEGGITIGYWGFPKSNIKPDEEAEFKRQLMESVRSVPGVRDAADTSNVPFSGSSWGHGVHVGAIEDGSRFTYADPHYFATMGIPVLTGRGFTDADTNHAPLVVVVNQAFIRKFIRAVRPIGQLVHVMPEPGYPERTYEIVGTIPDTKYQDLRRDAEPIAFVPAAQLPVGAQRPWGAMMIASDDPGAIMAVRRAIQTKYPAMTVGFFDFHQLIVDNLVGDRMMAMLSGFFGLLAALLVVVGLYGVLSYFVTRRRNEIGIRIALGAKRGQVIALVMRNTAAMLLAGIGLGTALALLAGRAATTLLFGVKPYDATTLGFAVALLVGSAIVASWVPARKASHLDPVAALRAE
jgi:predicted permease